MGILALTDDGFKRSVSNVRVTGRYIYCRVIHRSKYEVARANNCARKNAEGKAATNVL